MVRWPDDGPELIERQWDQLQPMMQAVTDLTGVRRAGLEEALAMPGIAAAAAIHELSETPSGAPMTLLGDPVSISALVRHAIAVAYAEDRLAGIPLDIVSRLYPQARGIPGLRQASGLIAAARTWAGRLRDEHSWTAGVEGGVLGDRAARVLSLAGIAVHDIDTDLNATGPPRLRRVTETDDGYELRIPTRGVRKDGLRIARAGEQVLVTTDGITVPVALPAALTRCRVSGASTDPDELVIDFMRDGRKWPA